MIIQKKLTEREALSIRLYSATKEQRLYASRLMNRFRVGLSNLRLAAGGVHETAAQRVARQTRAVGEKFEGTFNFAKKQQPSPVIPLLQLSTIVQPSTRSPRTTVSTSNKRGYHLLGVGTVGAGTLAVGAAGTY